jgi:DNA invertase Pin-like site-specific DNA recombinase
MTKKSIMFLTVPVREQRRYCDVPVERMSLSSQREAIKREATERNTTIVGEFVIPKPSNRVGDPLFRRMLDFISAQGIDYVLIYPDRPHRIYKESALIDAAINAAGAQVVSVQNVESVPDILRGILQALNDFDVAARRDALLRAKWKREQKAA